MSKLKTTEVLDKINPRADLIGVYLKKNDSTCHFFPRSVAPSKTKIDLAYKLNDVDISKEQDLLACFVEFSLSGTMDQENAGSEDVFFIRAVINVTYKIDKIEELTPEEIEVYSNLSAVFNAFPYGREELQSTMARMGLPPFTIPLLKPSTRSEMDSGNG